MIRLIAVSALPAALFLFTPATAEGFVTRRVTDTEGARVAGASIRFIDEEHPERVFGDTTAGNGSYSVVLSLPTAVEAGAVPGHFQLFPNYPNPFNSSTLIPYSLAEPGHVELAVYNLLGRRIRTLEDSHRPAGEFAAAWDGNDEKGMGVSAGVYLYRLQSGEMTAAGKMTLIDGAGDGAVGSPRGKSAQVAGPAQNRRYTVRIAGEDIREYWQYDTAIPEGGVLDFTVERLGDTAPSATTPEQLMDNLTRAGHVEILLLISDDEGYRVDQIMTFKLREGDDGIWRMVRWIDDPLVGDCSAGKILEAASWGRIKAAFTL